MNLAKNGAEMNFVGLYLRIPISFPGVIDITGTFSFAIPDTFAAMDDRERYILKGINEKR